MAGCGGVAHAQVAKQRQFKGGEILFRRVEAARNGWQAGRLVARPKWRREPAAPLFPVEDERRSLPRVVLQKGKMLGVFCKHNISHYFRAQMKKCSA